MADVTQNVLVDFQTNSESVKATIDLISQSNQISQESVATYKQVNAEIQKNTAVVDQNTAAKEQDVAVTTEQQATYDKIARSLIYLSGASKKSAQDLLTLKPADVAKGFDELGISVDDYIQALKEAGVEQTKTNTTTTALSKGHNTLRVQLQQTRNAMASLVAIQHSGQALTQEQIAEFSELALKAGKLSNALQQTNTITRNLSSDVPLLGAFTEGLNGMVGAYQAAVGAEALFGNGNKDLQETLVKVTSITAIAQGLQQSLNLVKKEGALATAALVVQEKIANIQKVISIGLESKSIVIRYAAIAAQKALNFAMSVNPILILVTALATFIAAIYVYTQATKAAVEEQAIFNGLIDNATKGLEAYTEGVQNATDKQNAFLKDAGASASTILSNTGRGLAIQQQALIDALGEATRAQEIARKSTSKTAAEDYKKAGDEILRIEKAIQKNDTEQIKNGIDTRRALVEEGLQKQIELTQSALNQSSPSGIGQFAKQAQLANAQAALALEQARGQAEKQLQIQTDLQNKIRDINIARQQFIADNQIAIDQKTLTDLETIRKSSSDRITQAEVDAQNKLDNDNLQRSLLNIKLTQAERAALVSKTDQQIEERRREFTKQTRLNEIADDQSDAQITLNNIQFNETQKLTARIRSINDAAEVEIVAARDNAIKIQEIENKRDNDILQARKDAIDQAAAYELAVYETTTASEDRTLERSLENQSKIRNSNNPNRTANQLGVTRQDIHQQFSAIDEITSHQIAAIEIQVKALDTKRLKVGTLNDDETKQYIQLKDQETAATEAGEKRKQDLAIETADKQKEMTKNIINASLDGVAQGLQVIGQLYQAQDQADQQRFDAQKQRIQDELAAGVITQKAADARNKELDAQQKKRQRDQAIRNKNLAIFQAIVGTAQAVVAALNSPPPLSFISAAIAGAIGAAQIAIIASQPIPQFNKGKKDNYEGFGQIAERNPEIFESNGHQYLVRKPTTVYLGSTDKVYNPSETTQMLENMSFGKEVPELPRNQSRDGMKIDYDKFGKSVADNVPQYGMEITERGFQEWVKKGNALTKYLNKRRSF